MVPRIIVPLLAVIAVAANSARAEDTKSEQARFRGTWVVVEMIVDGKTVPKEATEKLKFIFDGDRATLVDVDGRTGKEYQLVSSYTIELSKKPKTIDFESLDEKHKGEKTPGIYELDGDNLRLCVPEGSSRDRPKALDAKEGSKWQAIKLKRVTQ